MSDKFNALWIILNKLDKKEKVTARSLMEDLEVSERSVYRYITTLQVAGFPVDYDRAVNSYVFSDGYTLKKPDISVEETLALALSRKLLKSFGPDMERSLAKIEEKLSVKKPEDLITLTVAVRNYNVSKCTLHRAIKDGRLTSYKHGKRNSPVKISKSEIEKYWPKK